ncbi:conserved glycine-rich protein [Purpureocillium lavendulum]|uniref:Conserved glycine-rich protein n=1 Tax=Purpureocillium lavendulum TaxID=1247861 RepID=A0AB34FTB3_9HYPO|nr:conserved glycine-rich protein [Purpureocillium lavendulum]
MRFDLALIAASLLSTGAAVAIDGPRHVVRMDMAAQDEQDLYKRRGGGGGGGRGGGGGSGSGGSRGGGSSGGSGSSGSGSRGGSGSSGSSGNRGSGSNAGGTSRGGSGPTPRFGGGRFYSGGGSRPYTSGGRSPGAGILPFALVGAGALAFWPGLWLYGAYMYPYHYVHHYHNATSDKNETAKVLCGCARYAECGCDENNSTAYYDELLGNGSYGALNKSVVNMGTYKGDKTILINGTLPNGTTADGPDEDAESAGAGMRSLVEAAGFWPAVAAVVAAVYLA